MHVGTNKTVVHRAEDQRSDDWRMPPALNLSAAFEPKPGRLGSRPTSRRLEAAAAATEAACRDRTMSPPGSSDCDIWDERAGMDGAYDRTVWPRPVQSCGAVPPIVLFGLIFFE